MDLEWIRQYCLSLPGVTEDVKWGNDLCFCVAEKMFVVTGLNSQPIAASFKASPERFTDMIEWEGFKPAPYLARHKWIHVNDISLLGEEQWKEIIKESYELVKAKLSKKKQQELDAL